MTESGSTDKARRFYQTATAAEVDGGYGVLLDHRRLRTPGGAPFIAPTRALAEVCAAEWAAQGEHIVPASMPVTQLAFAAIDWTQPARDAKADFVASYAETDLVCFRAETPQELAARQYEAWQPVVDWAAGALGVNFPVVASIIPIAAPAETAGRLRALALAMDDFRLTALTQATALSGSVLLGFALTQGQLDAETVYSASVVDEMWSQERWGEDQEAQARLARLRTEFVALGQFLEALDER